MSRDVPHAVIDALAAPAIPNGSLPAPPRARPKRTVDPNGPVVQIQPPVHGWRCDGCPRTGTGPAEMLNHSRRTGHVRFTPRGTL